MEFRFQPLLNLRKHREKNCQMRLKEEQVRLSRADKELTRWDQTTRRQEGIMKDLGVGRVEPVLLHCAGEFLIFTRGKKAEAYTKKVQQEKKVEEARNVLVATRKETKTLERLKDRFTEREYRESLHREQKILDEIGVNLFHRKKG